MELGWGACAEAVSRHMCCDPGVAGPTLHGQFQRQCPMGMHIGEGALDTRVVHVR